MTAALRRAVRAVRRVVASQTRKRPRGSVPKSTRWPLSVGQLVSLIWRGRRALAGVEFEGDGAGVCCQPQFAVEGHNAVNGEGEGHVGEEALNVVGGNGGPNGNGEGGERWVGEGGGVDGLVARRG